MRVALFSAKNYETKLLDELNANHRHELVYFDALLERETVSLAAGFPAVSVFTNDTVDGDVLKRLAAGGTKLVATRSTGFNQIDVRAAKQLGVKVVRTDYSPNSVAEFGVGLLLALNRKICRAYNRTREGNFELDGLMGFDFVGRTVGVMGTGKIGTTFARIMAGFGCTVIGYDVGRSASRNSAADIGRRRDAAGRGRHPRRTPADAADQSHHQCPHFGPPEERCVIYQHETGWSG
jgi:D-lactate dehydrogenase